MIKDAKKPQDQAKKAAPQAADNSVEAELAKRVAELSEQVQKLTESSARAQAELQNAKIRLEKEAMELRAYASEATLIKLLPTIDNLQRALKHIPADIASNEWVKGIVAIEQDFLRQVGNMGLKRFESLGQPVDPNRHEVLMAAAGKADTVVEVLEDGYELHGKILRPAKVKVGNGE
jgi:molecular chaperone GrpE